MSNETVTLITALTALVAAISGAFGAFISSRIAARNAEQLAKKTDVEIVSSMVELQRKEMEQQAETIKDLRKQLEATRQDLFRQILDLQSRITSLTVENTMLRASAEKDRRKIIDLEIEVAVLNDERHLFQIELEKHNIHVPHLRRKNDAAVSGLPLFSASPV